LSAPIRPSHRPTPRRRARRGFALLLACAVLPSFAHEPVAAPRVTAAAPSLPPLVLGTDATVADVDGVRIGRNGLALLQRYAQLDGHTVTVAQVLDEVVEQRLLARHAQKHLAREVLFTDRRVAFTPEASAEEKLTGLLRAVYRPQLEAALAAEPRLSPDAAIVEAPAVTATQLRAVLGDPAQIRLDYSLDASSQRQAEALLVLRYRLPEGGEGRISLADVYARQNVQGRMSLHALDLDFLREQARARLAALLVLDWSRRAAGDAAIAELQRNLLDREYARGLSEHYGVGADMHDSNAYLDDLRQRVTPAEISTWYAAHREQFRRLERVRARHIRLADEAVASRVAAALRKDGSNFGELARQYSMAPDRDGGGELGWIARRDDADWFTELVFAQPPGRNGAPVREPVAADVAAHWEIVRVDEQQSGFFARDSETVRYLASRAIAEHKAREAFAALRGRLRREAPVHYVDAAGHANSEGVSP